MSEEERARRALLAEFRDTTLERGHRISLGWMQVEKDPQAHETLNTLMRELHSLKGEARMMGFADVSRVAHRTEELVGAARARGFDVPQVVGDLVLAGADTISTLVQADPDGPPAVDLDDLFARFHEVIVALRQAPDEGEPAPHADTLPSAAESLPAGSLVAAAADPLGNERSLRVEVDVIGAFSEIASEAVIAYSRHEHALKAFKEIARTCQRTVADLELRLALGTQAANLQESPGGRLGLAALGGLRQIHEDLVRVIESHGAHLYEGSLLVRELTYRARQLRLVPIKGLFSKYVRAVRDLAKEHGKEVHLEVDDGDVTLDKHVVDRIADPLLHLIRNAIDHGAETPSERQRVGKPPTVTLGLRASREGGSVRIALSDDGHGIDRDLVRQRALELGLVASGVSLSDDEVLALLFLPGFSTRRHATETSGRGIGLDVVKQNVERLGGRLSVASVPGEGTSIQMLVPISLALSRVLVVRCGDERYAVPAASVSTVLGAHELEIELVDNRPCVRVHDRPVPLVHLARLLEGDAQDPEIGGAIVLRHDDLEVALAVRGWEGDTEVIVKPLVPLLGAAANLTGACVLHDGALVLVLNPAHAVPQALGLRAHVAVRAAAPAARVKKRIVLVEDSVLTRTMIARILQSLGYDVSEAADGREALQRLDEAPADLVLTDIDMPVMNGIELLEAVRARAAWQNLPVVVLSTRGSDVDKARAASAGADAYLVKTEFSEAALREVLQRRLGGA